MSNQETNRTDLSELGEFGLINRIKEKSVTKNESTILGIGDDAALIDPKGKVQVVSTDLLIEGVHFDLSYAPLKHLGYKAISVNVSDIAAMNGVAKQVTVSIAISNRFSLEAIDELYAGIHSACENYNVDLVGGDTSSSVSGLVISVTAIGEVDADKAVTRSGANDKDIICATGDLGGAYMGLQVLEREKQVYLANPEMQPELDKYEYVVGRQLKPEARMDIIHELAELDVLPTSMIDISDGLASELLHLKNNTGLGLKIYEENLPIDQQTYESAVEFNLDPITCVLNGGEDYELLFTIKQSDHDKLVKHADIHFIGFMESEDTRAGLVTKNRNWVELQAQGWDHLK